MYQSWILPNAQITICIMFLFNSTPFAHADVLKQETLCRFKKSLILDKKKTHKTRYSNNKKFTAALSFWTQSSLESPAEL